MKVAAIILVAIVTFHIGVHNLGHWFQCVYYLEVPLNETHSNNWYMNMSVFLCVYVCGGGGGMHYKQVLAESSHRMPFQIEDDYHPESCTQRGGARFGLYRIAKIFWYLHIVCKCVCIV